MNIKYLFPIFIALSVTGCSKKQKTVEPVMSDENGTYFSIAQFADDQLKYNSGQPYTFYKIITEDNKADTTMVNVENLDWGSVFKTFLETDISDKKYLGKYEFTLLDDDATLLRTFYYEAKDPELYTKKLQISVDPTNNKIKSIYIEASKSEGWTHTSKQLYYAPLKVIQIQEFEKSKIGSAKESRTEYRFLVGDD